MKLQDALLRIYGAARSAGVLEHPWAERVFVRSYFLYKRYLEDPFHALIATEPALFLGGHVLDVGANVGYTAAVFARATDRNVYAFEPDARNFRMLERMVTHANIIPVHAAVGAKSGEVELVHNPQHMGDHRVRTESFGAGGETTRVPMVSLDDYVRDRRLGEIAFVKIDVQGYELAVCEGMREIIDANPLLAIALEFMPDAMRELGFAGADLLAFLDKRGFSPQVIERSGELRPFTGAVADYVNLLFRR
jgi:FkbM family methyltransferase